MLRVWGTTNFYLPKTEQGILYIHNEELLRWNHCDAIEIDIYMRVEEKNMVYHFNPFLDILKWLTEIIAITYYLYSYYVCVYVCLFCGIKHQSFVFFPAGFNKKIHCSFKLNDCLHDQNDVKYSIILD